MNGRRGQRQEKQNRRRHQTGKRKDRKPRRNKESRQNEHRGRLHWTSQTRTTKRNWLSVQYEGGEGREKGAGGSKNHNEKYCLKKKEGDQ